MLPLTFNLCPLFPRRILNRQNKWNTVSDYTCCQSSVYMNVLEKSWWKIIQHKASKYWRSHHVCCSPNGSCQLFSCSRRTSRSTARLGSKWSLYYLNQIQIECHVLFKTPHDRLNSMKDILLHVHINAFMTDFNNGEAVLKECTTGIWCVAYFSATDIFCKG